PPRGQPAWRALRATPGRAALPVARPAAPGRAVVRAAAAPRLVARAVRREGLASAAALARRPAARAAAPAWRAPPRAATPGVRDAPVRPGDDRARGVAAHRRGVLAGAGRGGVGRAPGRRPSGGDANS